MTRKTAPPPAETVPEKAEEVVGRVRERYARIAEQEGSCCGCEGVPADSREAAQRIGYAEDQLETVPDSANMGLGCGAPVDLLALEAGETVLDLGSGGGLDAFLAARRVGPEGRVIGVDMTPEMIERAREGAQKAGLRQVEFRQGRLEELPVEDASVDAVTSNCVINLVPDKGRVFREAARVLRPGGRMVVSDIILDAPLPEAVGRDLLAWVGCLAGALERDEYFDAVRGAGFEKVEVLVDNDAVALLGGEIPPEVSALLARTGVDAEELAGKVRSVTYRAVRS